MIVSDRYVYFHNPRTGGSSVTAAITGYSGPDVRGWQGKYHVGDMHAPAGRYAAEWADRFWFAFVRNPFDTVVSAWIKRKTGGALAEYVSDHVLTRRDVIFHHTQSERIVDGLPKPMDFIGRYETIDDDWRKVSSQIGVASRLPHRNKTDRARGGYRQYYDAATVSAVAEFFRKDLTAFNYDF